MDISYLLWLQGIREALPPFVEQFFVVISAIAASSALVVLPCLLFWCLDKRGGEFLLFSFSLGSLCNQFIKNTVCAYRPWIRSAQIHPAVGALPEATGYSFPSGHAQASASLIGGTGWYYRKKWPVLNVLCWVFVLLVAFSRNFLGVHTPQDVIVALVEAIAIMAASTKLLAWIDEDEGRDFPVVVVAMVLTVVYVLYISLKGYPLDYDAQGALLVDPFEMQIDCFKSVGVFSGAVLGWYLERHLIGFETIPNASWKRNALRFGVGIAVVAILHIAPRVLTLVGVPETWYELVKNFFTVFGATFVAPLAFTAVEHRVNPLALR
ncbi:MAG: phosphatase PAP2 family protein [Atopobiaceae bacterium]|nr:phosphatase PAP2 family protein [Atopobiaceae bacterium]